MEIILAIIVIVAVIIAAGAYCVVQKKTYEKQLDVEEKRHAETLTAVKKAYEKQLDTEEKRLA